MAKATFETLEGEEIEIDSGDVVHLAEGKEDETTVIELEDGSEVIVVATELEVIGSLSLNPLEFIDADEEDLLDDDDDEDGEEADED